MLNIYRLASNNQGRPLNVKEIGREESGKYDICTRIGGEHKNMSKRRLLSEVTVDLLQVAIIKLPACLTLLTLETYNLSFIASKLLTVADMMAI